MNGIMKRGVPAALLPALATILLAALLAIGPLPAMAADEEALIPRMSIEEFAKLLGQPGVVPLDVRVGKTWEDSKDMIKGAVRVEPREAGVAARKLDPGKKYVLYCT